MKKLILNRTSKIMLFITAWCFMSNVFALPPSPEEWWKSRFLINLANGGGTFALRNYLPVNAQGRLVVNFYIPPNIDNLTLTIQDQGRTENVNLLPSFFIREAFNMWNRQLPTDQQLLIQRAQTDSPGNLLTVNMESNSFSNSMVTDVRQMYFVQRTTNAWATLNINQSELSTDISRDLTRLRANNLIASTVSTSDATRIVLLARLIRETGFLFGYDLSSSGTYRITELGNNNEIITTRRLPADYSVDVNSYANPMLPGFTIENIIASVVSRIRRSLTDEDDLVNLFTTLDQFIFTNLLMRPIPNSGLPMSVSELISLTDSTEPFYIEEPPFKRPRGN